MGQAFDREGNVLGEAQAATKREVFDELERKHPTAHEIRVKAEMDRAASNPSASMPANEPMLQFFEYQHLPEVLRAASEPFGRMAYQIVASFPRNPERTAGLRKLLEAKDCIVRSMLYKG